MQSARRLAAILFAYFAIGCGAPRVNPADVAGIAVDGTFIVVDESLRNAPRVIEVGAKAPGQIAAARRQAPQTVPTQSPNATIDPGAPDSPPPLPAPVATPAPAPAVIPEDRAVQVHFAGEDAASQWSLEARGRELCETPCTLRYGAGTPITLVEQRDGLRKPAHLDVPYLDRGEFEVRARPLRVGEFAPGVVATAFGGMGTITGIVLTSVGCPQGKDAICTGGLITAGASSALLALGIWLIADSTATLTVEPAGR